MVAFDYTLHRTHMDTDMVARQPRPVAAAIESTWLAAAPVA